jgi:retinol dehydrogenase-12
VREWDADCVLVAPYGRFMNIRKDLVEVSKLDAEGSTGIAQKFWERNEEQIKPYL